MSDTVAAATTTDQWMHQFYQQQPQIMDGQNFLVPQNEGFSDSTVMTTTTTTTTINNNSIMPSSSESNLSPKGSVSKPIRRRSRASKRTPTTLLNANTTNFRALVQQFTGCPTTTMSSLIGVHNKGPITLNFQQGSKQQQVHHVTNTTSIARTMAPLFGGRAYYGDDDHHHQVQQEVAAATFPSWQSQLQDHHQVVQIPQQQLSGYNSFDHYLKSSNFVPSHEGSSRPSMEVSDHGLIMDNNDFNLHDNLTMNAFPSDTNY